MRERNRMGRGKRRRSGGDGGPDLFAEHLSKVVEQAFAATEPGGAEMAAPTDVVAPGDGVLPGEIGGAEGLAGGELGDGLDERGVPGVGARSAGLVEGRLSGVGG